MNIKALPKAQEFNCFKGNELYQWDRTKIIVTITKIENDLDFCLDEKGYNLLCNFDGEIKYDKQVKIKNGKSKCSIKVIDEIIPTYDNEFPFEIQANVNVLKEAVRFAGIDPKRPLLTAICLYENGSVISTDSYIAYKNGNVGDKYILLIQDFVNKIFGTETILKHNNHSVCFENGDTKIISRMIEGNYPIVDKLFGDALQGDIKETEMNKQEIVTFIDLAKKLGKEPKMMSKDGMFYFTAEDNNFETESNYGNNFVCDVAKFEKTISVFDKLNTIYKNSIKPILFYENEKTVLLLPLRMD